MRPSPRSNLRPLPPDPRRQPQGRTVRRTCRSGRRNAEGIYLIGETADEIGKALEPSGVEIVRYREDSKRRSRKRRGRRTGRSGAALPACASFDQFRTARTAARPSGGSLVNSMAERRKKGTTRGGKTAPTRKASRKSKSRRPGAVPCGRPG